MKFETDEQGLKLNVTMTEREIESLIVDHLKTKGINTQAGLGIGHLCWRYSLTKVGRKIIRQVCGIWLKII